MAEKKCKCAGKKSAPVKKAAAKTAAPCEKKPEAAKAAKVPNKKETVKLANAARKAQAEYNYALVMLVDALLAREAIKPKSPVVTKFAKASALEKEALDAIRELGY